MKQINKALIILIILSNSFLNKINAQDSSKTEMLLEHNGRLYNQWLKSTGLGDIIEYDTISIDSVVTFKLKGVQEENDPKYLKIGWENMQKKFYETEKESLHNRLFKTLSMLTRVRYDSLNIEINSNDVKTYNIKISADKKGNPLLDITSSLTMSIGEPVKVKVSEFKTFKEGTEVSRKSRRILSERVHQFLEDKYKNREWNTLFWYGDSKKMPTNSKQYYEITCLQNEVLRNGKFERLIIEVHFDRVDAKTYNVSVEVNCYFYEAWRCSSAEKYYESMVTQDSIHSKQLQRYVNNLQEDLLNALLKE